MEKTENARVFKGQIIISAVPMSDAELEAAKVPRENWPKARVAYSVHIDGEVNTAGVGGALAALIRCCMQDLPCPPGVEPALVRTMFLDTLMREMLAHVGSGITLAGGRVQ